MPEPAVAGHAPASAVKKVTSVAFGQDGGGPARGTGQPAVPALRTIVITAWSEPSWATNDGAAKLKAPPMSSSLSVSVAVPRPAAITYGALGLLSVRFTSVSALTNLLSMSGTVAVAVLASGRNVTVVV